jgi:hypothetical protein
VIAHFRYPRALRTTLLIALVSSTPLGAQGTAVVPPTDLVYRDLGRLAELELLDSVIVGQRPYSRRELARIARLVRAELERRFGSSNTAALDEPTGRAASAIARRLDARFGEPSATSPISRASSDPLDGVSLAFTSTDARRRGFPAGDALKTEATIDPLAERRLGSPPAAGHSMALEVAQRVEPAGWLAFQARERLEARAPRDPGISRVGSALLLASVRARYRNAALTVGRAPLAWSQGEGDGLFLASDAPALDQISLAGDQPFTLPGVLARLGPTQATLVYADLGPSVARSHSRLLAYKVSVKPAASLELGGAFLNHFGGSGGAPSSFGNRLIDFLPFVDIFRKHNYYDSTRTRDVDSDKVLGVDGRWRVPRFGGLLLTGELLIDDFDVRRIPYLFTGYGSSTLGITLPRLGSPAWSMRLSAKHMGILTYTHDKLTNGITTRGRLLGDELGPDAKAFGAELRWQPDASVRVVLEGRSAIHSLATYRARYVDIDSLIYEVYKVSSGPDELRDRLRGTLELHRPDGLALVMRTGMERVRNSFLPGEPRRRYAVDVALRLGL